MGGLTFSPGQTTFSPGKFLTDRGNLLLSLGQTFSSPCSPFPCLPPGLLESTLETGGTISGLLGLLLGLSTTGTGILEGGFGTSSTFPLGLDGEFCTSSPFLGSGEFLDGGIKFPGSLFTGSLCITKTGLELTNDPSLLSTTTTWSRMMNGSGIRVTVLWGGWGGGG